VSDTAYDKLKAARDDAPDFRRAWAEADAEDRDRFIEEVLLNEVGPKDDRSEVEA
jgi:hypothetical protein